jgi:putative Mg2+ transporter-C (MgtC) family protein
MEFYLEDLLKIALALLAGGLIGVEREFRDKSAGFRTLIFICLGSTVFAILSARLAPDSDPTRIAANIVTGIGFLGAGAILRDGLRITGLTTAATIWLVAAVGMAIGGGQYLLAGLLTAASVIVLWFFPLIENQIDKTREVHTYEIAFPVSLKKKDELEAQIRASRMHVFSGSHCKQGGHMRCTWVVSGTPARHARLIDTFLHDADISEFRY